MKPISASCGIGKWGAIAASTLGSCAFSLPAIAQIVPDNTLPSPSNVEAGCITCLIEGGTLQGNNLFHSFSEFSVPTGGAAIFNNLDTVEHIFSRVTGDSVSDIDGLIQANGTAHVFLLNPNGILFGPNAQLNIGGSFISSTANAIQFDDQAFYSASEPAESSLLTIDPSAFLFNQIASQRANSIEVQGFLEVPEGQSLVLLGNNLLSSNASAEGLLIDGGILLAPSGYIGLSAISGFGRIELNLEQNLPTLELPETVSLSDITLMNQAFVSTSGESGGAIAVQGRQLILNDGSVMSANTLGTGSGGQLIVNASEWAQLTNSSLTAQNEASGTASTLSITTGDLLVQEGGQISTSTLGNGSGGNIAINASESVQLIGTAPSNEFTTSALLATTRGVEDAGDIEVNTRRLIVTGGAEISSFTLFGQGDGGNITINASESLVVAGESPSNILSSRIFSSSIFSEGTAGALTLTTGELIVEDGAQISSGSFGEGMGGTLAVNASESIQIAGVTEDGLAASGLFTQADGSGNAGDLTVSTGRLIILDGGRLSSASFGEGTGGRLTVGASEFVQLTGTSSDGQASSGLFTQSQGSGTAGELTITTRDLIVEDGAQISSGTLGEGRGGALIVNASGSVQIVGTTVDGLIASGLFTQTESTGDAGELAIATGQLVIREGGQISSATSDQGAGGRLVVDASEFVQVIGTPSDGETPSGLFTQANGLGSPGELVIITPRLQVQDRGVISASNSNGEASNISVLADILEATNGGGIFSITTGEGDAGDIILSESRRVNLTGSGTGLFASTTPDSSGDGGSIFILDKPSEVLLREGARIAVDSQGSGRGGEIRLNARFLSLDTGSEISAATAINQGGNIRLTPHDILLLRNGSLISTNAGIEQGAGNGGNITIDAADGFIVAVTEEDSNITANAFAGRGGNIAITAQGIFGIEPRDLDLPFSSDITASSELGLEGTIQINTLNFLPNPELIALPSDFLESSQLLSQGCEQFNADSDAQGEFYVSGRGGIVPIASETLGSDDVVDDLRLPQAWADDDPIIEAQGWFRQDTGEVVLTAAPLPAATEDQCWR